MNKQAFLTRFILQNTASVEINHLQLIQKQKQTTPLKKAAVLIPLIERNDGLHMLLTQRALHLKHHPGQVSFPGGKVELSDDSFAMTALRETEEEIGIPQNNIELVGSLPPLTTTSGFHVTPFIGFIADSQLLNIDDNEVQKCFEVPCSFILNSRNFSKQYLTANKQRHFTYCCAYQNNLIWGATAQMIINLQQHLAQNES